MSPKKIPANYSLLLRGTTWHIHWNVPRRLRSHPFFDGKAMYAKSLKTSDVHEARKMRDKLVSQFMEMAEATATQLSRRAFMDAYAEVKQAKEDLDQRLMYMEDKEAFDAVDGLESAFSVETAIEKNDIARADAYLAVLHNNQTVAAKYSMTLKDAAWEFIKEHEGKIAPAIISRIRISSASLIKSIGKKDVKLKDVTKRQVTRWITDIASEASDGTRRGYIAALHKMWHWAWMGEHVEGSSPFREIKVEMKGDEASYEDFTVEEISALLSVASRGEMELMRYGLITGCRMGELLKLSLDCFVQVEGVHAIQISEGKTKAATRTIPLPAHLWGSLRTCVSLAAWEGKDVATWSKRFSTLKKKALKDANRSKSYHSFRHMAATSYERAGIEERITSVILGHKNKRGESMSYGLYSAGLSPAQYLEAVEKMLESPYMSSFLKLFKS